MIFRFILYIIIFRMLMTTAATCNVLNIASVHRKRLVYIFSLNQPKLYSGVSG